MSPENAATPALRADLLMRAIGQEAVIWSPLRKEPIALDPVAAVLCRVIDGEATVADLVADVHEVVDVPIEHAKAQVQRVLTLLDSGGALTSSRPVSTVERQRELFTNPPST